MSEQEPPDTQTQATGAPVEQPSRAELEPRPALSFRLIPGERVEITMTSEGDVMLTVRVDEPVETLPPDGAEQTDATAAIDRQERQERITVSGLLSGAPRFRTTKTGRQIASFSIAEHPDSETTVWHRVLAFDARADQLRQNPLDQGQAVEVVGYRHHRDVTTSGVARTIEEIYATSIRRR